MKRLIVLAAFSTALIAGPAAAQLYVGAGVGDPRPDHGDVSWKAVLGMQFSPAFGGEIAYHNFGKEGGNEFDAESVAGTLTMPIADRWAVQGKVGVARVHAGNSDDTNLYLGAGIGYALTQNLAVGVEYEDFGKVRLFPAASDRRNSNVSVGARYLF